MKANNDRIENQSLTGKQKSIVIIAALTATGATEKLQSALAEGLDAKLTVNEIKEVLVQMYAYAGFPRSLNGISTFMKVLDERKKKGIIDEKGKKATPINQSSDKYERGRKTLEKLSGQPQSIPAKGFGEFSPEIDRFLKEHLFADIFDSDVLTYQARELATISALAAMTGVESQLESHLGMGINIGLTEKQLTEAFDLIEKNISGRQAEIACKSLATVTDTRQNTEKTKMENKEENAIFPKGENAPAEYFTGTVFFQILAKKTESNNYTVASVSFEKGARSNWHTHPAGQTLIVINGEGLYQEKGNSIMTIHKGETVVCNPDIEHWHGASPESEMTHIAITNDNGNGGVIWLKPVTDEEYNAGKK